MQFILLVVACLIATTFAAQLNEDHYRFLFTHWAKSYKKTYEVRQFFNRFEIFRSNLDLILAHNAQNLPWKMAANEFADLSSVEFETMMGLGKVKHTPKKTVSSSKKTPCPYAKVTEPQYIDWLEKGTIGAVKNQASCGSCWAFSSVSAIEAAVKIHTGKDVLLSEQQLVDCSRAEGNEGCNGGLMSWAAEYYQRVGGACESDAYPYTARDGSCKDSSCTKIVQVSGYNEIKPATDDINHKVALQNGPISVGIAASSSAFQFYSSGVLTKCADRSLNHAVVLVAYKEDKQTGIPVYSIRNSWGKSWGDAGYIHIAAAGNLCGLHTSPWDVEFLL